MVEHAKSEPTQPGARADRTPCTKGTNLGEVSQEGGHEPALRDLEGGYVVLVQHGEDLSQRPLAVLWFSRQVVDLRKV